MGEYPTYLYDENPFNDVQYLLNKDIIFKDVYPMLQHTQAAGITSFDESYNWNDKLDFGYRSVCSGGFQADYPAGKAIPITKAEKQEIQKSITQNITDLTDVYPNTDFYYFITPYSAAYWKSRIADGTFDKILEAEQYIMELMLPHDNIYLYSFNSCAEITTDLNNYKDKFHYGEWINSVMLQWMYDGKYRMTQDNYLDYLQKEKQLYWNFDYESLAEQADYWNDAFAAARSQETLLEIQPVDLSDIQSEAFTLSNAQLVDNQYDGKAGIQCSGADSSAQLEINDLKDHKYLVFFGKKTAEHGQPNVCAYDKKNNKIAELTVSDEDIDNNWHEYVMELPQKQDEISIAFQNSASNDTENAIFSCVFRDIIFY